MLRPIVIGDRFQMAKDVSLRKAKVFTGMLPDDMSLLERIGRRELFNPGETVFTGKIRGH